MKHFVHYNVHFKKKKNLDQKNICILSKDFLHKNLSP